MSALRPPSLICTGKRWSSEELTGMAASWAASLAEPLTRTRTVAMVMANHPESVALFFALSCCSATVVLLPPDLRPWRSTPPLPRDTRLVLLSRQRDIGSDARALGVAVTVLPEASEPSGARGHPPFLTMPGLVLFTSGSTGVARPVFRRTIGLLATARSLVASLGLAPGNGIVTTLPLARAFGLHHGLIAAAIVEGPLGLLDRFEHHRVLRLFASREFHYWAGMPAIADVLSRCALSGPPVAPAICLVGARVSPEVAGRFEARFGVPLRQGYGTTETGGIAVDGSAPERVRFGTVGRAMRSVEIRVGADPGAPEPPGMTGRFWVRAPASMMEGYGFPPDIERPDTVDGWWATPDVGSLHPDGYLSISGRVDDTFRTSSGHLVSPAAVAAALEQYPGVSDTAVVPLAAPGGPVLGVLVESAEPLAMDNLRERLLDSLPAWSQPRVIQWIDALPRLSGGKIDRNACIAILDRSIEGEALA